MSAINKRQQARNERALQDLIKNVPGNDKCADCGAKNPGWASWNLGVFLCVRCASLHRKLGTHVSKIKSLSMDTWSSEQVDNMKRIGNAGSNKAYNPKNTRPAIPVDADEVDGVMERFIRQKYDTRTLSNSSAPGSAQHTGSSKSSDEHQHQHQHHRTPELPPKPSKRFTFALRSTSAALPFSRSDRGMSPPVSPGIAVDSFARRSPPRKSKPSKIFGTDIGGSRQDNYELKLIALRDMGFPDDKRNLTILKGENGNVDRAVATLIRLGEGARMESENSSPVVADFGPETPPKDGIAPAKPNPFDRLDLNEKALPPPPPEELSPKPPNNAWNPFLQPTPSQQLQQPQMQSLQQNFGGLHVSQPGQLFPNMTGGYTTAHQTPSTNPFLQTYTPPPPAAMAAGYGQMGGMGINIGIGMQPLQPVLTGTNPFLSQSQPPAMPSTNPFGYQSNTFPPQEAQVQAQSILPQATGNPFASSLQYQSYGQANASNPFLNTSPSNQSSLHPFNMAQQQPVSQPQTRNPWGYSNPSTITSLPQLTQTPPTQSPVHGGPFAHNPFYASIQPTAQPYPVPGANRVDKASILALYSAATTQTTQLHTPMSAIERTSPFSSQQPQSLQHGQLGHQPKRSLTMPLPITSTTGQASSSFSPAPTTSFVQQQPPAPPSAALNSNAFKMRPGHESVDFMAGGLLNGRHSPDIFSGLSARIGR